MATNHFWMTYKDHERAFAAFDGDIEEYVERLDIDDYGRGNVADHLADHLAEQDA